MFTDSRSIDDRATAASFDTALQKYAAATESWFDGTPFSIDARLAQCKRLIHIARQRTARRGADAGPLTNLAALEADSRALVALREDLLTGAYDRQDNAPIAGVRVASDETYGQQEWWDSMSPEQQEDWKDGTERRMNERRENPKNKEAYFRRLAAEYTETHPLNGMTVEELIELLKASVAAQAHDARHRTADCGDDEEFADGKSDEGEQPNDYLFDEMGRYHRDRFKGDGKKESALSPQDRRYVTLESSRFLAENTDTNDARELATRAMHFAQRATSTYDVNRSRLVTSAFVQKVADGAAQRGQHVAALKRTAGRQSPAPNTDGLPPEALFL